MPASPTASLNPLSPNGTMPLRPVAARAAAEHDTTDYELSNSVVQPAANAPSILIAGWGKPTTGSLDQDARRLFQQRLKLCFLVAAFPFLFFIMTTVVGYLYLY